MKKFILLFFLISFLAFSPKNSFSEEDLTKLLPDEMKSSGFQTPSKYGIYDDRSLYDYLDGGAPFYIDRGFSKLINEEYSKGGDSVIVDIYMMKDEKSSADLFKVLRRKELKALKLGKEGQEGENQIEFFQNKYFVRITAFKTDQKTKDIIKKFGEITAKKIADSLSKVKKK
ncbi:MAG: hypothetical protein A2042_02560 [Candidatus Schekmanbacteria bacterium GWA2_38_11]|uniref:Uncharacterized protein n=1 Tax=Candidatus Schekmanbacteria bacterium GWA2_38_11 TaxID=1817876 RepID=A0A1F7RLH7_9BACT|nr:MAG: hypothetical protein A2042_02560 [Candidatus Schekmanbacteria bacterium GWA2_38_11]